MRARALPPARWRADVAVQRTCTGCVWSMRGCGRTTARPRRTARDARFFIGYFIFGPDWLTGGVSSCNITNDAAVTTIWLYESVSAMAIKQPMVVE